MSDSSRETGGPSYISPRWARHLESNGRTARLRSGRALVRARHAAPDGPMTQAQLAAVVGCNKSLIGHLESGKRDGVYESLARAIADAVGVKVEALFETSPEEN